MSRGYELKLTDGHMNFDVFVHSNFNETHQWASYYQYYYKSFIK